MFTSRPALLSVFVVAVCVVLSWPFAETGMHDDGYYILIVQGLARTGHVSFNGWGAPMLGIQLLPAALLIKLVGFSFSTVRCTTVVLALLTTALVQRTLVRCGLGERNASIATITLMTSPVVLPLVTSFLTDIWSLFAIALCLYGCLRALQAASERGASGWICLAALGNALFGSARQIAWLGVLVMVPSTLWLLRRQRRVQTAGWAAVLLSLGFIAACMVWLSGKPYVLPERYTLSGLLDAAPHPFLLWRPLFEVAMLTMPVLVMFLPALRSSRRVALRLGLVAVVALPLFAWHEYRMNALGTWNVPFLQTTGSVFGPKGVYHDWPVWGDRPAFLPVWVRSVWSFAIFAGIFAWLALGLSRLHPRIVTGNVQAVKRRQLAWVTLPFAGSYLLLLLPRALRDLTLDRYLVPLAMLALLWLVLQYQEQVRSRLPAVSLGLALAVALYSAATLQDAFAMYRTVVRAGEELQAAGIQRAAFDGGGEYDGITQVQLGGYVHQYSIRLPPGQTLLYGHRRTGPCEIPFDVWIPDVNPAYTLSYAPNGCGGRTGFAPLRYRRLLWPHWVTVYVVQDPDLSGKHGLFPSYDSLDALHARARPAIR